jgi:beta-lactamase superfamily II metal-dependent hydrolase
MDRYRGGLGGVEGGRPSRVLLVRNPDHIGGFLDVFEVGVVYVSGDLKGTLTYNSFLQGVRDEGSKAEVVRAGRRLDWGGVRTLVAPPPGELFSETNDNSLWPFC